MNDIRQIRKEINFQNLPNNFFRLISNIIKKVGDEMEKKLSVVVFTTPTCSWCRKVKSYLQSNKIRYKEVDVSRDARAMRDMVKKSGQMGVPQIWVNNKPIVGFDKEKIDRLIGIKA